MVVNTLTCHEGWNFHFQTEFTARDRKQKPYAFTNKIKNKTSAIFYKIMGEKRKTNLKS